MNLFIALGPGPVFDTHFPPPILKQLEALGPVRRQEGVRITEEALIPQLGETEALITHWGAPRITARTLEACPTLRIVAHGAGTVAQVASDALYERHIPVLSANAVLSKYVAEAIVGYMIAGTRRICQVSSAMKQGVLWPQMWEQSLFGAEIAFVGLGMVGRWLLPMLAPFGVSVRVYDPYIEDDALAAWPFARKCETLAETVRGAAIMTLQAAKTPETFHLVNAEALALLPDGALVVNAGRGAVMDTAALEKELAAERLWAVLDVYEQEPLPVDSSLRRYQNTTLIPHKAGVPAREKMTQGIIDDLKRFQAGEPLQLAISYNQYKLMTQE